MHILLSLFVLLGFHQVGQVADAMAVYNNTSIAINAYFDCGFLCNNAWKPLNAGDSTSRPNKSGTLSAISTDYTYGCNVDVDTHGWVVATGTGDMNIVLTSYHQDGTVRETCNFIYESPS